MPVWDQPQGTRSSEGTTFVGKLPDMHLALRPIIQLSMRNGYVMSMFKALWTLLTAVPCILYCSLSRPTMHNIYTPSLSLSLCTYIYIYIYIYREREREREYIYIYINNTLYIVILVHFFHFFHFIFHSCTVHLDTIKVFYLPTDVQ